MANWVERRKTRRDRRLNVGLSIPLSAPAQERLPRRRRERAPASRDLVALENQSLQNELREHIVRLQEANKQLLISSLNSRILAEQLRAAKVEMTHLAHHDHLTELPNRIQFKKQLARALTHCEVQGNKLALLFIDLDRFKVVNDSLGHAIGDQLLQAVAQRLAASVRTSDLVSRQGGDEFVVMLGDVAHAEDVASRVSHIHKLITAPYTVAHHVLHIGASVGISMFPDDVTEIDALIRNADIAMYSVKERGRNNFAFFEKPMDVRAVARHQMEADLHTALARDEFELYYQAQVELATCRIRGAEALVRWNHPSKGLLLPKALIGFAEECGMIQSIDRWVLKEACQQARDWLDAGYLLDSLSVNISAQEFECADFLQTVFNTLDQSELPPHHLELELTESTMMRDCDATILKISQLRLAGVRIAIDDFGTGYSSLGYLRRLPIDTLKIDQTFVADICPGTVDVLVGAVIDIGRQLRHHVIAEGIETDEQLQFLRDHHCSTGQGFHLSHPMTASEFAFTLAAANPAVSMPTANG